MSGTTGDDPLSFNTPDPMQEAYTEAGIAPDPVEGVDQRPVYKVFPESRIPVSSRRGPLWRSRKEVGEKCFTDYADAWDEAIRYYNMAQQDHRNSVNNNTTGNRRYADNLNDQLTSTENIVFANINAQVPELYAKNPIVTITAEPGSDPTERTLGENEARAYEKLITALFAMRHTPGVNLKPKARKNVLLCLLTNRAWFEVGYVKREQSSEQALNDLKALSEKLAQAKNDKEIRECEASLIALEERVEFLQPSGPYVRIRSPWQVIVDPDATDGDIDKANWILIGDMLPTEYINAVYGEKMPDSEEVRSIFEPTHVLTGSDGSQPVEEDNYSLFSREAPYQKYGFRDNESYRNAQRTKVWYLWDKVTRRLELYADNDWKWPIWVWDDPYGLQGFFPLTLLEFHDNPVGPMAKGEVSYYLDQQDQVNEINDEKRRWLHWIRRNIFFDIESGITQDEVNKILDGPNRTAKPLRVPDGKTLKDMIFSIPPPSAQFASIFDKTDLYRAIDRIAATSEADRGGEFKTNTTNKAIDYYSTMGNMRMDSRLDAIEDCIADVGWKLLQLCLDNMSADVVQQITGLDVTEFWRPTDKLHDFNRWSMRIVGGSTQKLSSQAKKRDALEMGQVLAQFARSAPTTTIKTVLHMFSEAFDGFVLTKEDWQSIDAEVERTLVAGQGGAPGVGTTGGGINAAAGSSAGGGAVSGQSGGALQMASMVTQALEQLPPEVLRAVGIALAQGAQPRQILQQMISGAGPSGAANAA